MPWILSFHGWFVVALVVMVANFSEPVILRGVSREHCRMLNSSRNAGIQSALILNCFLTDDNHHWF